jgi:glycosyltransferase involved in cell wall biosynthesis
MKKIVLLSGNRIAPAATGGQLRTLSMARALARLGHSVHILSTAGRREDYRGRSLHRDAVLDNVLETNLRETTCLGLTYGITQAIARRMGYPRVWQHRMFSLGLVPQRLKDTLRQADIILSDLPYCPPIPGSWSSKPWYLISHNLEHKLLEQGSARQRRYAEWMRRVEASAPRIYTDIFACAEEDRDFFQSHDPGSSLKLPLVRCGVDPGLYALSPAVRQQVRADLGLSAADWVLVFSGSGFAPNVEALGRIKAFCAAAAGFLLENRVHFLVVGSVSSIPYRDGPLIVTGPVPDVVPFFAAGDAGLNMVTRGSGSNVKLFEYLAARLPVISTLFGVRGTELKPFTDYLPCGDEDLREVIRRFVGSDRRQWAQWAEDVWRRHRRSCDIQELVNAAVAQLPHFG